jgi:hypothetical protein
MPGRFKYFASCCATLLALAAALGTASAQQPSGALQAKSVDAAKLAARLSQGPARVIVYHREPTTAAYAARGTPSENVPAMSRDLAAVQDALIARHFATRSGTALRRMEVTPAFAVTATAAEIESLANDSAVSQIVLDQIRRPVLIQSVPLIGMTTAYSTYNATGAGWAVAIIDSGVDKTHTFLQNVIAEACYSSTLSAAASGTANGSTSTCPGGASSSTAAGSGVNCNIAWAGCEHGTHVAGIAAGFNTQFQTGQPPNGVAKSAGIIAIKAASEFTGSDCSPASSPCIAFWDSDMMAALDHVFAIRNSLPSGYSGVAAANLSIGGDLFSSNCDTSNPAFKTSIDNLLSANIATVVAAGNDSSRSQISFPACISSAIAVAASSKTDTIASYSDINSQVAVFAPGGDFSASASSIILSSVPAGYTTCASDGAAYSGPNPTTGGTYCYLAGTSMATPHVAGAFAAIRSALPNATVAQILSALKSTGTSISDTRSGGTITKPRINVAQTLQSLGAAVATLLVTPSTDISSSGVQGGPFSPTSFSYSLSSSFGSVNYAISNVPSWLNVSSASGTVTTTPTTITFTVNSTVANATPASTTTSAISFTNTSNSAGNQTRNATLTVTARPSILQVSPASGMAASGTQGGSFTPASFQYSLSADTGSVDFSISGLPSWLTASQTSGTTPATITFALNSSAATLGAGTYTATIAFTNATNGQGNQNRSATLTVNPSGSGGAATNNTWVDAKGGSDSGICPVTAPCLSLNYALSQTNPGGVVSILTGGNFGPIVINRPVTIFGPADASAVISANPSATVGCVGSAAGSCATSTQYAVEIAAGVSDTVELKNLLLSAGSSGSGALKIGSVFATKLNGITMRGDSSSSIAQIMLVAPNTNALSRLFMSDSDVGFGTGVGAMVIQPVGLSTAEVSIVHSQIHSAQFGVWLDSSQVTSSTAGIQAMIDACQFFSFNSFALDANGPGAGFSRVALSRSSLMNAGQAAVQAVGPNGVIMMFKNELISSQIGAAVNNGTIYSFGNNGFSGNGSNVSGSITSSGHQ